MNTESGDKKLSENSPQKLLAAGDNLAKAVVPLEEGKDLEPLAIKIPIKKGEDNAAPGKVKVEVSNIPKLWGDSDLFEYFQSKLQILEAKIQRDPETDWSTGKGIIKCASFIETQKIIEQLSRRERIKGETLPLEMEIIQEELIPQLSSECLLEQEKPIPIMEKPSFSQSEIFEKGPLVVRTSYLSQNYNSPSPTKIPSPMSAYQSSAPQAIFIEYFSPEGAPYYYNTASKTTQWERPPPTVYIIPSPSPKPEPSLSADSRMTNSYYPKDKMTKPQAGKRGPPGCNVFIFHLPNEWTEQDLFNHFSEYGNLISTRMMIDKTTGRNKGYGFASYDNPQSAQKAVAGRNGFSVLGKRLKVELKKGDDGMDVAYPYRANRPPM